jgi:hypothetical protein
MADKAWQDMTERERTDHLFAVLTTQAREVKELRATVDIAWLRSVANSFVPNHRTLLMRSLANFCSLP